jgi:GNAT superfamily N-acetyltransferase
VVTLERILAPLPAEYFGMTFSTHAGVLSHLAPDSPEFAVAATESGQPAGFALARMTPDGQATEVLSLFVTPPRWSRGIGTRLLQGIEQIARERGASLARINYSTQSASTAALERILGRLGWTAPRGLLLLAQLDLGMTSEPWIRQLGIRAPHEVFPWVELTAAERGALEGIQPDVPAVFRPFPDEAAPDPRTSLGLRLRGEVIGWMLTHQVAPKIVRYTTLYVREPWQRAALTLGLLAESIRRAASSFEPGERAALAVRMDNAPMVRLLQRKFRPHAAAWHETRISEKALG